MTIMKKRWRLVRDIFLYVLSLNWARRQQAEEGLREWLRFGVGSRALLKGQLY
jgi:hypothetical protein